MFEVEYAFERAPGAWITPQPRGWLSMFGAALLPVLQSGMGDDAKAARIARNSRAGADWENLFYKESLRQGFLARKVPPSCKILWNGGLELVDCELDFQIIHRTQGVTAFVDTKSFHNHAFTYSMLGKSQIELATVYNECNVQAGFCVYFSSENVVSFFTGKQISQKGPRSSFGAEEGIYLGKIFDFSIRPIFS